MELASLTTFTGICVMTTMASLGCINYLGIPPFFVDEHNQQSVQEVFLAVCVRLQEVFDEYRLHAEQTLPVWALYGLAALSLSLLITGLFLLLRRCGKVLSLGFLKTCLTERERQLTDSLWEAKTEIDCLTGELHKAKLKMTNLDGQLEQLLNFVMNQDTESAAEVKSLKDRTVHLEKERAILLSVAQQQEQIIELLRKSHNEQAADSPVVKPSEKQLDCGENMGLVEESLKLHIPQ